MSPYVVVAGVVLAGLLLFVAAMAARRLLAPSAPTTEKLTTYESGVDPVGQGWAQTNVRYFLYAFLYVIFAVDAVYLFPWATVIRRVRPGPGVAGRDGHLRRRAARSASPTPPAAACCGGSEGRPMPTSTADADAGTAGRARPRPIKVVLNWGRRYSLWVFNFGLACCAIEFIAASMARHDFIRLGVIPFAPGPRQADLMVVSGTVTDKMAPAVRRLYDQMPEPKYVISFGACSNCGGPYWDSYCVTKGVDQIIPVDVYVPGCPPRPEALLQGILRLQEKIAGEDLTAAACAPVRRVAAAPPRARSPARCWSRPRAAGRQSSPADAPSADEPAPSGAEATP